MTTTYVNEHNYYLTLQAAILSSYASFVVVFSRSASHIPALFSSTHIVLTALFLGRLYMLTSTGQRLIRWEGRSPLHGKLTGGAAKSIHPTTRKEKYIIEKTAGF